jgi:hypothetical protein
MLGAFLLAHHHQADYIVASVLVAMGTALAARKGDHLSLGKLFPALGSVQGETPLSTTNSSSL